MISLRRIDRIRLNRLHDRTDPPLVHEDIWYIHTVLAQCFLPYRDPKTHDWTRKNGDFSIALMAGHVEDPTAAGGMRIAGLPYGAKPRLFQSYVCTQTIKQQSPVIPVERSMSAMMQALGLKVSGGREGSINAFKDQITRFAACHFTIVGPGPLGTRTYIKAPPIKKFDVWFPLDATQHPFWPTELVLTDEYYYSLKDHAVPYDFRALKTIQNKPRAQDIYLWMTQRLCRLDERKPLFMPWHALHEMFGGELPLKHFKVKFPKDLFAARTSYPEARVEEMAEGFRFRKSPPPIPKVKLVIT